MDPFDRQIVQYVQLWAPFGGPPPEEVFLRFGLRPSQFDKRFKDIVASLQAQKSVLADKDKELLAEVERALATR